MGRNSAIDGLQLLGNPGRSQVAGVGTNGGGMGLEGPLHVESCAVVPLAEACCQYQDLGLVVFGGSAHAATIDVLDGCVNNAIGLINVVGMSKEQHQVTNSNVAPSDPSKQAGAPTNEEKNPFVPEIAREEVEDVYVDLEHAAVKRAIKIPAIGLLALFGVLLCVAAIFLISVFKSPLLEEESVEIQQLILENERENQKEKIKKDAYELTSRLLKQVEVSVRGYYAADQISEKLKYVRQPERVRPLMEKYYQQQPVVKEEFHQLEKYGALNIDKVPFVYARVQMENGTSRDVLLERLADESFKLDWEVDVHYQPLAWDGFIELRPSEPLVMRVAVKPDSFHVYQFRDSSKYDCYQLTAKGSDHYVFGYVVKGSEVSIQLRQIFMRVKQLANTSPEPMMLQLRFPEGSSQGNCVHIDRIVAPRWFQIREP